MDSLEIFKIIEDFPNYEISNYGKVRVLKSGLIRKVYNRYDTKYNKKKRQDIGFKKNRKQYAAFIHKLVMAAFGSQSPGAGYTIDHKDRDPFNNHISNLRWATKKEQSANRGPYVWTNGLVRNSYVRVRTTWIVKKLSIDELEIIYNRLKTEKLQDISKEIGITDRNLHILMKYMHPLYI